GLIKGDWYRLSADYVRPRLPEFSTVFLEEAVRTLSRAEASGPDPQVQGERGLCELEQGRTDEGLHDLDLATAAEGARPSFSMALARAERRVAIDKGDALPHDALALRCEAVRAALRRALASPPASPEAYTLFAQSLNLQKKPLGEEEAEILL